MADDKDSTGTLRLASSIVAAYFSNPKMAVGDLPNVVRSVYDTLASIARGDPPRMPPAVPVEESLTRTYVICLEDGLKFKSLRRHLTTVHAMSPEEYRARWGLPATYPMVSSNYSSIRSRLAKKIGLGSRRRAQPAAANRNATKRKPRLRPRA
jgi:predicted transcriptional regulator